MSFSNPFSPNHNPLLRRRLHRLLRRFFLLRLLKFWPITSNIRAPISPNSSIQPLFLLRDPNAGEEESSVSSFWKWFLFKLIDFLFCFCFCSVLGRISWRKFVKFPRRVCLRIFGLGENMDKNPLKDLHIQGDITDVAVRRVAWPENKSRGTDPTRECS